MTDTYSLLAETLKELKMNVAELTSTRMCRVEGVERLHWVTADTGAFGNERDGPLAEWIVGHELFMQHVKKFDVVVQAGGNCGMYARFYKNYFKEVYTFEPDELNYYCLDKNCQGEGFHKFNGGLGNTTDKLSVKHLNPINCGMHVISDEPGDIQMHRIDDLKLEALDLLHLDIEGYEAEALKGGLETIKKFKPVIILENATGHKVITELGYQLYARNAMDHIFVFSK